MCSSQCLDAHACKFIFSPGSLPTTAIREDVELCTVLAQRRENVLGNWPRLPNGLATFLGIWPLGFDAFPTENRTNSVKTPPHSLWIIYQEVSSHSAWLPFLVGLGGGAWGKLCSEIMKICRDDGPELWVKGRKAIDLRPSYSSAH